MTDLVSVRDLRNRGGAVIDDVARGGAVTITKDGVPVAELRALGRAPLTTAELIRRRQSLPDVDPAGLRHDLDELVDPSL